MISRRVLTAVMVSVVSVSGGTLAQPQQGPPPDAPAVARHGFGEVSGWLAKSADLIPADKYSFKPVGTVRSAGEMLAHAADGMHWYCGMATGKKTEWSDAVEKGPTDKPTIVAALKKATDGCAAVYADPKARLDQLFANIAHANLHYGNLVTYMRILGLTPPSS